MANLPANSQVFQLLEKWAPENKAYDWDNVGLQVGSYRQNTSKILVTLDVNEAVADEAIKKHVNLIIAHHPLLFKPLKQINTDTPKGRIISKLMQHDITVYAAHTNLDIAEGGVNHMLADRLELINTKPLVPTGRELLYKYAVYVPLSHQQQVKKVIGDAGGGEQGDYSHCSFAIHGTGSFKPGEAADPYIGERGELAEVDEVKLEALVQESKLQQVAEAVKKVHPYEEPAYDIIELSNPNKSYGLGRIGEIGEECSLEDYIKEVKKQLNLANVRVAGNLAQRIKKIAVLGGSGEKYIQQAKRAGADVLITGDVGFHAAQDAIEAGIAVIDAGHYIEEIMKEHVKNYLQQELAGFETEVITSDVNTDPFQFC
jgi:dinuclear metal center YbgI/SA1388 family protein